jgi:hypothetical protein
MRDDRQPIRLKVMMFMTDFNEQNWVAQFAGDWVNKDQYGIDYQIRIVIEDDDFDVDFFCLGYDYNWLGDIVWQDNRIQFSVEYYGGEIFENWILHPASSTELIGVQYGEYRVPEYLRRAEREVAISASDDQRFFAIKGHVTERMLGTWEVSSRGDWEGVPASICKIRRTGHEDGAELLIFSEGDEAEIVKKCVCIDEVLHLELHIRFNDRISKQKISFKADRPIVSDHSHRQAYRFVRLAEGEGYEYPVLPTASNE